MGIATARERDMRMPGAQIGFDSGGQCCILHPFMKLKKMWMTFPNANPNDFHVTLGRKREDPFDRQKKSAKFNRAQFFAQRKLDIFRHFGKETARQEHLTADEPTNTANRGIKLDQTLSNALRLIK